jgi:glc operon protein GlcG
MRMLSLAVLVLAMSAPALAWAGDEAVVFKQDPEVREAFAKGMPLVEVPGYKVHASRRDAPGMAEVHEKDTDIIYVLEGSATLVTGGVVVEGRTTAPDEIRGDRLEHGKPTVLRKGDLMIVPNGTPHWFEQVSGPFLYYVVKVTAGGGVR